MILSGQAWVEATLGGFWVGSSGGDSPKENPALGPEESHNLGMHPDCSGPGILFAWYWLHSRPCGALRLPEIHFPFSNLSWPLCKVDACLVLNGKILIYSLTVKPLSTMREIWVRALGSENSLKKEIAIHSSTIAWKIPWTEEPGRLQSMGSQRVGHDWLHFTSLLFLLVPGIG